MLGLPIYLIGSTYYLHTRIEGRQVKRSLRTSYQRVAIIRAINLMDSLMRKDLPSKYEIDVSRGIFKANGAEDHARLIQAVEAMKALHAIQPAPVAAAPVPAPAATAAPADDPTALKLCELLERFLLLKSVRQATADSYRNTATEVAKFLKNPPITRIAQSDITRYQEHLAQKGNSIRTIDNKISTIRALYNFAKKQAYTRGDNPAENRSLLTKKQRLKGGWATFETDEVALLLGGDFFREQRKKAPDYVNAVLMGLFTACRVGEITALKKGQFKRSRTGVPYITIDDSKTLAGIRDVPLHSYIFAQIAPALDSLKEPEDKLFKYKERDGKGSGNAVGKMFARNLESARITREKLVFHSLRKYVNNELMQSKVSLEHRCQFAGHELDNVNVAIYTKVIGIDELAASVFPTLDTIAETVDKAINPMAGIVIGDLIDPDMLM
ncbi:phage integrase N-terminal SAM-like domain-containing protein [Acidovorax sp. SUPP2522]|uniref:phage integrase n=1 Tax=unclassified Acidovorax TaxID=2684926 RepID=UPI00234B558B|nr:MULTISPECIES: site-specific integrase [unclassified Acidovorax]WCM98892.1 site-specific integrase [Acidovorax sp. GBBC 1281]GKT19850.1 phage integrase N-terminal SAM-like domain-containing protein [Acidovorax sp. SUPP2522]